MQMVENSKYIVKKLFTLEYVLKAIDARKQQKLRRKCAPFVWFHVALDTLRGATLFWKAGGLKYTYIHNRYHAK